jgi:zona occludens toxin
MLTVITGTPGNGKTLRVIQLVEKLRKVSQRQVFYWNIGALTLDWKPLGDSATFGKAEEGVEPDTSQVDCWYDVPAGSIVVIDEAQKIFPVRKRGADVPKKVSEFETHRHRGIDIFLMTQNPKLIDAHVRKLTGKHHHLRRVFGSHASHIFTWTEECADVDTRNNFSRAQDEYWKFPKELFGVYKSAEVHTHKRQLPWKWIAMVVAALILFPGLTWVAIHYFRGETAEPGLTEQQLSAALESQHRKTVNEVVLQVKSILQNNPWDSRLHQPRVDSLDASRPFFDELVRPVSFPKIAGCGKLVIGSQVTCECYSQQGTVLEMGTRQCMRYLQYGWFDFTRPDEEQEVEPREGAQDPMQTVGVTAPATRPPQ